MTTSEHVLLESADAREVPELRTARRTHARVLLRSRLRRRSLELTLFDYCYLSVVSQRSRGPTSRYVLDLRFVDPKPRVLRRVASRWLSASVLLASFALIVARDIAGSPVNWWHHDLLPACIGILVMALGTGFVGVYRTTESLALHSMHGQARLLRHVGGLGTFRALRAFQPLLTAHLKHAVAARRRLLAEHLRDEMREHARLRDLDVLSETDYEISKRRILAAHAIGTRSGANNVAPARAPHRSPAYRVASAA